MSMFCIACWVATYQKQSAILGRPGDICPILSTKPKKDKFVLIKVRKFWFVDIPWQMGVDKRNWRQTLTMYVTLCIMGATRCPHRVGRWQRLVQDSPVMERSRCSRCSSAHLTKRSAKCLCIWEVPTAERPMGLGGRTSQSHGDVKIKWVCTATQVRCHSKPRRINTKWHLIP